MPSTECTLLLGLTFPLVLSSPSLSQLGHHGNLQKDSLNGQTKPVLVRGEEMALKNNQKLLKEIG